MRVLVVSLLVLASACVGPARDFHGYEGKAVMSAAAMISALETTRMTIGAAQKKQGIAAYLSQTIEEQEEEASGAESAFASIQPPDHRSDEVREKLGPVLSEGADLIEEARIAMRRGDLTELSELEPKLADVSSELDDFLEQHQ